MAKGGFLDEQKKKEVAAKMAYYSGLSEKVILQHNLDVPTSFFWKELLRDKGFTIGRLDSRYLGIDRQRSGSAPRLQLRADFVAPFLYARHQLLLARASRVQDRHQVQHVRTRSSMGQKRRQHGSRTCAQAMATESLPARHDPIRLFRRRHDLFQRQVHHVAFGSERQMKDRLSFEGYRSGHMMYLRQEDLASRQRRHQGVHREIHAGGGAAG